LDQLQALQRKDIESDSVVCDLAAELAHWQDRDRNQKINAMARCLDQAAGLVDEGRMRGSSTGRPRLS